MATHTDVVTNTTPSGDATSYWVNILKPKPIFTSLAETNMNCFCAAYNHVRWIHIGTLLSHVLLVYATQSIRPTKNQQQRQKMKNATWFLVLIMVIGYNPVKTRTMKVYNFKFYTDYHQFYIEDGSNENKGSTASTNFWNDIAFKERLALINGIIGVGVESYGNDIKGEIEILEKPNTNIDYSRYDHIVAGGINIQSGELQILNCPDSHLELSLKITPGQYRVRVYSSNLASVKEPDLANDTDNDYYRIELWKSDEIERTVLKQYEREY